MERAPHGCFPMWITTLLSYAAGPSGGVTQVSDETDNAGAQSLERKLATILSADVAEFSRLMGEDEEKTLKTFRGHKQVFESLVAMHRGRIFNTAGDAILAEFASAVEAVRAATDIQAALSTRNDQLPPSRQVRFRIGINLGDVMVHGEDLLGDGVNVAARLQTAAQPGGICISGSVFDQIRNKLSLSFQSLGEMHFKNIQQTVRTFSIVEGESGGALPSPQPHAAKGNPAKWIAASLLLLAAGGAYWAYTARQQSKVERARAITAPIPPEVTPREAPKPSPQGPATEQPQPAANNAHPAAGNAGPGTPSGATRSAVALEGKPAAETSRRTISSASLRASAGLNDGVYAGQICYGQTATLPVQCFNQQGTVRGSKITGQWPAGKDTGITMFLTGDVAPSGNVKIEMHSKKSDGTPVNTINLTGTLHEGLISTQGHGLGGRSVTLNWSKNSGAPEVKPAPGNARAAPTTSAASSGRYDGVYSGQICYGQTPKLLAQCYHAEGTISRTRITGQWPVGKDTGVTMFLAGNVAPSGDIKIEMHSQKEDGSTGLTINLTGTVQAGLITAQGSFLMGRSATLNWRKNAGSSR